MIKLLLISLVLTGVTVLLHGVGTLGIILRISSIWKKKRQAQKTVLAEIMVMRLVVLLLLLHLVEAAVWAAYYFAAGLLETPESALYFSLTSYGTLGYGDVVLAGSWRMLGPIESLVGVLMMGWSTGIIVAVILRVYAVRLRLDFSELKTT